ncbi:hypothetical protein C2857_002463 [Epichloe festucae Fl1]|uniref:C2H2-type domain-containing protein n=1 Tax=Epichloe festucae (strain Fl1) TaxID=877507 RepID=A0A7U3Q099_EPIFF|nr:hypothetical protein C2857_002463 [Epichloe festucae Fl1]
MASVAATTPAGAGTAASHPYTCNSCQVAYRNIDLQKGHMKSDWHRYNLKRRVASLPPISSDVFSEKVIQARASSAAEADKAYFERACEACNKTYYSENAYQNHLLSSKHKVNETAAGGPPPRQDDETTSVISSTFSLGEPTLVAKNGLDSDAEDEFNQVIESLQKTKVSADQRPSPVNRPSNPRLAAHKDGAEADDSESTAPPHSAAEPTWTLNSCIFCNFESPSLPLSVQHMERFHGMFIPETAYLADLEGLVKQLQRKVSKYHECLSCGKMKSTVFGVQTHMRDKGHCKIPFTSEEDQLAIGDFYDFRSTYSDGEDDEDDEGSDTEGEARGGAKLGSRRKAKIVGEDGKEMDGDEDAEGWETDSSASSLDSADLTAVPAEGHIHQYERLNKHPHHSSRDPRVHRQVDGYHSRAHKHTHAAFYDDYELHLPTGKSVGHRSLNKYFRQNLNNYPTPEERAERLAIEGADSDAEEGSKKDRSVVLRNGQRFKRDIVPRGTAGLANVTDEKKKEVRKSEHRGRDLEQFNTKRTDWSYGKRMNNQKTYYYRYDGGG